MAFPKDYRSAINLNKNELLNFAIEKVAVDPVELYQGRAWFNTTENKIKYFDGVSVQTLVDVTTLLATTLDKFAKTVADLDVNNFKLINVADGTEAKDAVNKSQLDTVEEAISAAITALENKTANGLKYIGAFDASAGSYDAIVGGKQGNFYKVSVDGDIGGIEWKVGDMLILNRLLGDTETPVAADIDKIDNTEAADIIREGDIDGVTLEVTVGGGVRIKDLGVSAAKINADVAGKGLVKSATTGALDIVAEDDTIEVSEDGIKVTAKADFRNHKAVADIGDAVASTITVTHTLGTKDVMVQLFNQATGETVEAYTARPTTDSVVISFNGYVPAVAEFRLVIIG